MFQQLKRLPVYDWNFLTGHTRTFKGKIYQGSLTDRLQGIASASEPNFFIDLDIAFLTALSQSHDFILVVQIA